MYRGVGPENQTFTVLLLKQICHVLWFQIHQEVDSRFKAAWKVQNWNPLTLKEPERNEKPYIFTAIVPVHATSYPIRSVFRL